MRAYILIIDDNHKNQQLLRRFLTSNGYKVDCAYDGLEGIEMYKDNDYDMVLLETNIPILNGFSVCKMIREESNIPIIFVTESSSEHDQIMAFDLLCDDYIIKPFSYNLLIKRVEAILRRVKIHNRESYIIFEKIKLNLKTYCVEIDNETIDLTLKEFKILKCLIQSYPQVVTREKLLDIIWGYDYFGDTRIVDAHIKNIRKKIILPYIKTVKGIGYTLKKDI